MYPLLEHVQPTCLHPADGTSMDTYGTPCSGPLSNPDQIWPDLMIVTAGVKHCFPSSDHRGVTNPDTWRTYLPKAVADRKIMLVDTRQLSNPEQDRGCKEKNCIGRRPGIIDQLLSSGTGMYLIQSTWEAIEKETKLDLKLVVIDSCNANRQRSAAKGAIMSAICVQGRRAWPLARKWQGQLEAHELWRFLLQLWRCGPRKGHLHGKACF